MFTTKQLGTRFSVRPIGRTAGIDMLVSIGTLGEQSSHRLPWAGKPEAYRADRRNTGETGGAP